MARRYPVMIEIETTGGEYRMAEATIRVGGQVVGYVGGSGHESTVLSDAETAIAGVFRKLLAEDPDISQRSRFDDYDDDDDFSP